MECPAINAYFININVHSNKVRSLLEIVSYANYRIMQVMMVMIITTTIHNIIRVLSIAVNIKSKHLQACLMRCNLMMITKKDNLVQKFSVPSRMTASHPMWLYTLAEDCCNKCINQVHLAIPILCNHHHYHLISNKNHKNFNKYTFSHNNNGNCRW